MEDKADRSLTYILPAGNLENDRASIRARPWQITDTISSFRKILFSMVPQKEHHVATIVSGSRSHLRRFEDSLVLIRAAPEMHQVLMSTLFAIRSADSAVASSFKQVSVDIETVLARASSPFSEG